jgi:hypothetical protein
MGNVSDKNERGFTISTRCDNRLRSREFSNTEWILFRENPPFDYYCRIVHQIINQTSSVIAHAGLS